MSSLALWSSRWRFAVIGLWIVVLVALAGAVGGAGTAFTDDADIPDSESSTAYDLLADAQGSEPGTTGRIVWQTEGASVDDPAVQAAAATMLADVARLPGVLAVVSPYSAEGAAQLALAEGTAFAIVTVDDDVDIAEVRAAADQLDDATTDVALGGAGLTEQPGGSSGGTEAVGVLAALVLLLLVFRSPWAAALPIVVGLVGVGASLLLVMLGSHVVDLSATSLTMAALIGLGVGIDYALFIVNRFRKALMRGMSVPAAVLEAVTTSGRAVVFAGLTVVVALLGMVVVDLTVLTGMGRAAAVTVLFTVLAAVTLLPALLCVLGHRVLSKGQRAELAGTRVVDAEVLAARPGPGARWAARVDATPRRTAAAGLLLLLVVAAPVLALQVGNPDASSDPAGSHGKEYADMVAPAFGEGVDATLVLVAETPDAASASAFADLVDALPDVPGVASVSAAPVRTGQEIAVASVTPTTSAGSVETQDLVREIRDVAVPQAVDGTGLEVHVGGEAATNIDISETLMDRLPLYLGLVALLGFVLLAIAFRSILVPLVGALSNILTLGVGLGVVTAVFQLGWGSELLGVGSGAPIMYIVPVILVGVMFGLSMDYQVFLVSRMHEEWTHTGDNARSIRVGLHETSQVIAVAATIMFCVFASFGFSGERIVSAIGIGLAVAVALDAFVVRLTVVPAVMRLIGRRNWAYPAWADRITPHLSVEGPSGPAAPVETDARPLAGAGARTAGPTTDGTEER